MASHARRFSRRSLLSSSLGLIAAAGAVGLGRVYPQEQEEEPALMPALLDGVLLPREEAEFVNGLLPVAVIVDNFTAARPQIGLDRADLVYELLVEGGITRFMAVYLRREAEWVEPVRSARTPFLPIARELGAVVGHVGAASTTGEADADGQFGRWGVLHLDEQHNPGPFWRDRTRYAPHNAVTSTIELRGHALGLGWQGPSAVEPWLFKEDFEPANQPARPAGSVSYAFLPPVSEFAADWYYDADSNSYLRWMAGRPHVDGLSGAQLTAKNLVVQGDAAEVVDREGHVLYGNTGEGPAFIFLDGQVIDANWSKPTREARTRYFDLAGEEIRFNRGTSWVSLVPFGSPLAWE